MRAVIPAEEQWQQRQLSDPVSLSACAIQSRIPGANVVMRASLTSREYGVIDTLLKILVVRTIFSEKDKTSTRTTEGLVAAHTLE